MTLRTALGGAVARASARLASIALIVAATSATGCERTRAPLGESTHAITLMGEGATFPLPLYTVWASEYRNVDRMTTVTYKGTSSSKGAAAIASKTVSFGASDTPLANDKAKSMLQIPMTLGGVVAAYNLPGYDVGDRASELNLNSDVVSDIYLGKVTRWNHPEIAALNADAKVPLPNLAIQVVYRSGESGTTTVFTDYLNQTSEHWATSGKGRTASLSIAGTAAEKNSDVAEIVSRNPGAIGYMDFAYAVGKLRMAALQNAAGRFVVPTLEGIAAAASAARPSDLTKSILNPPGESSYPIPSFSYVLVYQDAAHADEATALARFLWWAAHDGQTFGPKNGYVTLPAEVLVRVESLLLSLTTDGRRLLKAEGR